MPPKPWHRAPTTSENSGELAQQIALQDPEIAQATMNDTSTALANTVDADLNQTNTSTNPIRSSPYGGSSYGGMGGMSSYGGMGGMGMGGMGMGGMGMGMGGMGMMGMGGMGMMGMGGQNGENQGFFQTMQMMQGMNFAISSLCQVAQTVEQNAMGIQHLFSSLISLIKRTKDWGIDTIKWLLSKAKDVLLWIMFKLRIKRQEDINSDIDGREGYEEIDKTVSSDEQDQLKEIRRKKALYSFMMKISLVILGGTILQFFLKGHKIVEKMEAIMQSRVEESVKNMAVTNTDNVANATKDAFDTAFNQV